MFICFTSALLCSRILVKINMTGMQMISIRGLHSRPVNGLFFLVGTVCMGLSNNSLTPGDDTFHLKVQNLIHTVCKNVSL